MRPLRVYTTPGQADHRADDHVERPERHAAAVAALEMWEGETIWSEAPMLPAEDLLRVHTAEEIETVRQACLRSAWLDADTYASPASWHAALHAAGGALAAARDAARGEPALALTRPPGHHATRQRPMGFCLFNHMALAADALAREGQRVAIVDIDVHHGNGTQDIFWDRDDVLYVSLHGAPLYPGTGALDETGADAGAGATVNLPLPANTAHAGWMEVFHQAALPAIHRFAPDTILVSAGYDGHKRDPIGNLLLTNQTFHESIAALRALCPRIAAFLEGGYNLEAIQLGIEATAAALTDGPAPAYEPAPDGARPWPAMRERVARAHPGVLE